MRQTTLKRSPKGFYRSLGKRANGSQPKFMLGHDKPAAEKKLAAIIKLWETIEGQGGWTPEAEATAKAIAKGTPATLSNRDGEHPADYFRRLTALAELVPIEPKHAIQSEDGKEYLTEELIAIKAKLFGEKNRHRDLTGQTLFNAIESFRESLLAKDGEIKDGEKTLADQLKSCFLEDVMAKCVISLLHDEGQVFQESWELADAHRIPLADRLKRVAQARLRLLASNLKIVQLKSKGNPLERMNWKGIGGKYAQVRVALKLIDGGKRTGILLRGFPSELFGKQGLTTMGIVGFREFNRTATECGCEIIRDGLAHSIISLSPLRQTVLSHTKGRKATLRKLISILGEEEAQKFWDDLKERQKSLVESVP